MVSLSPVVVDRGDGGPVAAAAAGFGDDDVYVVYAAHGDVAGGGA